MSNEVKNCLITSGCRTELEHFIAGAVDSCGRVALVNHLPVPKCAPPDWCVNNWGSKWGDDFTSQWLLENDRAIVMYNTAWAPMTPFFLAISKVYRNLQFHHKFHDYGLPFVGEETIKDGEVIYSDMPDYSTPGADKILESFRNIRKKMENMI